MNEQPETSEEYPVNYYQGGVVDEGSLRFRVDADDVITKIADELRGGLKTERKGVKTYHEERRMMNEEGVSRVVALFNGIVNKVGHLTKYQNEERVVRQLKSVIKSFIFELILNLKRWAPSGSYKVRNKRVIIQMVENAVHASMLRADGGFEANNLSKIWNVNQIEDYRQQSAPRAGGGWFGKVFGRGGGGGFVG